MKHLAYLFAMLLLAACNSTVRLPGATVSGDGYEVRVDGDGNNNGRHCPPGQAKKGRC